MHGRLLPVDEDIVVRGASIRCPMRIQDDFLKLIVMSSNFSFDGSALTKSELSSLDFIVNRFFMKLFKTNNSLLMLLKVVNYISDSACQVRNG